MYTLLNPKSEVSSIQVVEDINNNWANNVLNKPQQKKKKNWP